jgi:hypothetical protein
LRHLRPEEPCTSRRSSPTSSRPSAGGASQGRRRHG